MTEPYDRVLISILTAMISTIVAAHSGTTALSMAATACLAVFLIAAELVGTGESEFLKHLRRNLWVFGIPLLVVFSSIVIEAGIRMIF